MTPKQRRVLKFVAETVRGGTSPTIDQVLESVAGNPGSSKQAMQQTLEVLERKGLLSRSYVLNAGTVKRVVEPTREGYRIGLSL